MKVIYSHPLTAPQVRPPSGFATLGNESDLSLEFGQRYRFLGRFTEYLLRLSLAVRLLFLRRNVDAVVTGRYGEFFALLQSLVGFGRKPCLLLDIEWYAIHSGSWRSGLNRWLHRRIVHGASRIQVFCHAESLNYAAYFGVDASKFVWIPYCMDVAKAPEQSPTPGNFIFTSGTHQRDYATLLAAVTDLPLELHIAAPVSAFASLRIPSNVKILGTLPADRYRSTLLASRFVVVSLDPHVLRRPGVITYVGAMSAGKCVVVNDPLGASSYIQHGDTGFLVGPQDPVALRAQLLALAESPETVDRIGQNAQRVAMEQFSAVRYFPLVEAAVQEAIDVEKQRGRSAGST